MSFKGEIKKNGRYTPEFLDAVTKCARDGMNLREAADYMKLDVIGSGFRQLWYKVKRDLESARRIPSMRATNRGTSEESLCGDEIGTKGAPVVQEKEKQKKTVKYTDYSDGDSVKRAESSKGVGHDNLSADVKEKVVRKGDGRGEKDAREAETKALPNNEETGQDKVVKETVAPVTEKPVVEPAAESVPVKGVASGTEKPDVKSLRIEKPASGADSEQKSSSSMPKEKNLGGLTGKLLPEEDYKDIIDDVRKKMKETDAEIAFTQRKLKHLLEMQEMRRKFLGILEELKDV